ncbi:uncharacterized protein METZ01_LOCUS77315 [marine metagenome]|uniref:Membrane protein insertase YidC n=1 Tax=marine metagenome TaxID=408172 RepID=A0A381U9Q1_9ZZZZ
MERQVLLAVFLSFLVLVLWQRWVGPPPIPTPTDVVGESPADGLGPGVTATPQPLARAQQPAAALEPVAPAVALENFESVVSDGEPREIVVEGEYVRAVFSNRGAKLISWQLKQYDNDAGGPVELIPAEIEPGQAWPFSLGVPSDPQLTARLDEALFRPSASALQLSADAGTLTFDYEDSSGLRARKSFTFQAEVAQPYVIDFDATVTTAAGSVPLTMRWGPALGGIRAAASRFTQQQMPAALLYGRAFEGDLLQEVDMLRARPADLSERSRYEGQFVFAGVDNHYFLAAVLPNDGETRIDYRPVSSVSLEHDLVAFDLTLGPDQAAVRVFLGPKDFDVLAAVHPDLVRAVDFGWLSALVVPLHRTLKWINGFVGNYGWSIVLLTVLINIVIFPLRHKSVVSMRKMQELAPEMKAIQARYAHLKATDPAKQKMQQETMELYKKHGANPVSGCLPMLLTMPILFAMFRLLSAAVEIRGAPFTLWVTDLSVHDPLYVTPLLMSASMFVQQRLQPSAADPMQQKMMLLMPIVFTFMFLWAPSGLVLYWLTSNLFGIGQQLTTNRIIGPPKIHQVRPPAEGKAKPALAEKTVDVEPTDHSQSKEKAGGATIGGERKTVEATDHARFDAPDRVDPSLHGLDPQKKRGRSAKRGRRSRRK